MVYGLRNDRIKQFDANDVTLDSNHSYFLFVDDETPTATKLFFETGSYASEILLRSLVESELKRDSQNHDLINNYEHTRVRSSNLDLSAEYSGIFYRCKSFF